MSKFFTLGNMYKVVDHFTQINVFNALRNFLHIPNIANMLKPFILVNGNTNVVYVKIFLIKKMKLKVTVQKFIQSNL